MTSVDPALDRFVAAEHARLVGMLALYTGDRWVADELAQDAIVRLCQHWPRVREMADRRAWLNRVAFNLANSWFRRRGAERRALAVTGPDRGVVEDDTASTLAIRRAVADLPPRQRTAVVLRHFEGLSVTETATAMRCAEGTVKALTHRGVTALRAAGLTDHPTHDRPTPDRPQEVTRDA